jgi:hypothetical protein
MNIHPVFIGKIYEALNYYDKPDYFRDEYSWEMLTIFKVSKKAL